VRRVGREEKRLRLQREKSAAFGRFARKKLVFFFIFFDLFWKTPLIFEGICGIILLVKNLTNFERHLGKKSGFTRMAFVRP
jgi:hypothetical protein